jgi:hypothetical protein
MPGNFDFSQFRKLAPFRKLGQPNERLREVLQRQLRRPRGIGPQHRQRGYYNIDLTGLLVFLIVVGVLIGLALAYGVPWLWGLIKPLIHGATA